MPTESFYKLDENKRKKIVDAMKKEFSRVSFHEASINKIVEDAGISKGSFWVYFKSKEEAIEYLIDSHLEEERQVSKEILQKNNGDLFAGYIEIFDYLSKTKPDESGKKLLVNIFTVLVTNTEKCVKENNEKCLPKELKSVINTENLGLKDDNDLWIILKLLNFSLRTNLSDYFMEKVKLADARKNFVRTVEILANSISKEGEKNDKN